MNSSIRNARGEDASPPEINAEAPASGEVPPAPAAASGASQKWFIRRRWPVFAALALLIGLVIYFPVRHFEFLNFDDDRFISENPWLTRGFGWASLRWAFTANLTEFSMRAEYWSPLTLLSRLLDARLYGIAAGPFHVTSALLHGLNALLLCGALFRLTGNWRRSALVALIFLAHPLNVEPVCWLSARKDVLSGTFFFCTLLAYAHYARRPCAKTYAWLGVAFCCGLMAKPMVITTPLVLLALDWWPLGRWQAARGQREEQLKLIAEKLPLIILSIGGAILAVLSQQDAGAIGSTTKFPLLVRVNNALVSYVLYLRRIFWPSDLAALYPHPGAALPIWEGAAAALVLVAFSVCALRLAKRLPFAITGWLWFGIILGPVIGLVQIGNQAQADRYTYPSAIGIFIIAVWGLGDGLRRQPRAAALLATGALAALTVCSMRQVLFWRDSLAVFARAAAVTKDNSVAYLNLGDAYHAKGDFDKARASFLECARLNPAAPAIWMNLGNVELDAGRKDAALHDYDRSLQLSPEFPGTLLALARMLLADGKKQEAIPYLERAIRADPEPLESYFRLGILYQNEGRWPEAENVWTACLRVHPGNQNARRQLSEVQAKLMPQAKPAPAAE